MTLRRRDLVLGSLGVLGSGCEPAAVPKTPQPEPVPHKELDELAPTAGLEWVVRTRPREIAAIPWLIPAILEIVPEANQSALQGRLGFDPRQCLEAIFVSYGPALSGCQAQLVRHNADPALLEKKFLERLTSDIQRSIDHPEVIRLRGKVGKKFLALTLIGKTIAVYDDLDADEDGVARIAALYALGKMTKAKTIRNDLLLASTTERFGDAPVITVAPGPFVDEWKSAARGLLEVADAIGVSLSPASTEAVRISGAIRGDFGEDGSKAADLLRESWEDVGASQMGRILGFHDASEPVAAGTRDVITLNVMVDPMRAARGLRALLEQDLPAIMKL